MFTEPSMKHENPLTINHVVKVHFEFRFQGGNIKNIFWDQL